MSMTPEEAQNHAPKLDDVGEFLAHSLALENEAAERYDELADSMEVHNNHDVVALFRKLAEFSRMHAQEVKEIAAKYEVPHLKPWEFQWVDPEGPESGAIENSHYKMTNWHVLQLALHNEERGQKFYAGCAVLSDNADVKKLAQEFAEEESEHVDTLKEWIPRYPKPKENWDEDMDPPAVNE